MNGGRWVLGAGFWVNGWGTGVEHCAVSGCRSLYALYLPYALFCLPFPNLNLPFHIITSSVVPEAA